jgi:hypothetical protein
MEIPDKLSLTKAINNERGFVLILSMIMLVVLTLLALAMSTSTLYEINIAGNERVSREQFFKADAGVNVAIAVDETPADAFLPAAFPNPFANCNNPRDQLPFAEYDLDNDGTDDVALYLLSKQGTPAIIDMVSCATLGTTTAQIQTGLQYGLKAGAGDNQGDILSNN